MTQSVFGPASSLYVIYLIPLNDYSSTRISLATAWSISCAPLLVASFNVMVASYLAWIGQIGMQLVLPAQARQFDRAGNCVPPAGSAP